MGFKSACGSLALHMRKVYLTQRDALTLTGNGMARDVSVSITQLKARQRLNYV
jgi:hypothetical protein